MTLEDGEHIYSSRGRPGWKKAADIAITLITYFLIAYVIVSWIPGLRNGPVGEILEKIMGPIMTPVRKIVPPVGGLDFSVLIVYFGLSFIQRRFLKH